MAVPRTPLRGAVVPYPSGLLGDQNAGGIAIVPYPHVFEGSILEPVEGSTVPFSISNSPLIIRTFLFCYCRNGARLSTCAFDTQRVRPRERSGEGTPLSFVIWETG